MYFCSTNASLTELNLECNPDITEPARLAVERQLILNNLRNPRVTTIDARGKGFVDDDVVAMAHIIGYGRGNVFSLFYSIFLLSIHSLPATSIALSHPCFVLLMCISQFQFVLGDAESR